MDLDHFDPGLDPSFHFDTAQNPDPNVGYEVQKLS